VITAEQMELRLERAAHQETRVYLARALRAAQWWQAQAKGTPLPGAPPPALPIPIPSAIPTPAPDPGAPSEVMVVCAGLVGAVGRLIEEVGLPPTGYPSAMSPAGWVQLIRTRLDALDQVLALAPTAASGAVVGSPVTGDQDSTTHETQVG
jgi:hypothetical protein